MFTALLNFIVCVCVCTGCTVFTDVLIKVYPLCYGLSFNPSILFFALLVSYRKIKKLKKVLIEVIDMINFKIVR